METTRASTGGGRAAGGKPEASSTLDSIRHLAAIPVWTTDDGPSAGRVLGVSRDLAYRMARDGQLPTITAGSRRLVPVPPLRRMLGDLS